MNDLILRIETEVSNGTFEFGPRVMSEETRGPQARGQRDQTGKELECSRSP